MARRGGAAGRVLAIALPTIVLAVGVLEYANGSATSAVLWGGVIAVVIYAIAASFTRRASRTPNVWALVSRVVGVALLFLVGGGAAPSAMDAVLLVTGTVLLLGPFLLPRHPRQRVNGCDDPDGHTLVVVALPTVVVAVV